MYELGDVLELTEDGKVLYRSKMGNMVDTYFIYYKEVNYSLNTQLLVFGVNEICYQIDKEYLYLSTKYNTELRLAKLKNLLGDV